MQQVDAGFEHIALFQHDAVVAGDIRLALCAVYQHGVDLVASDCVKLAPQGECCAAQTDNAAVLHSSKEGVKIGDGGGSKIGIFFHLAVAFDPDDGYASAVCLNKGLDSGDSTRNGCVNGRGHSAACCSDKLTDADIVAYGDNGLSGAAAVHGQGKQNFRGGCNFCSLRACSVLVMVQFKT